MFKKLNFPRNARPPRPNQGMSEQTQEFRTPSFTTADYLAVARGFSLQPMLFARENLPVYAGKDKVCLHVVGAK